MNIKCVKWGDKFSAEHVNRLYHMCKKNIKTKFKFTCITEDSEGINSDIHIKPLNTSYDLETWWWKLCLFEDDTRTTNIFFDLDVVIQKDVTHIADYVENNKLMLVKAYWKPWLENAQPNVDRQFDMNYNSSVMVWRGNLQEIWTQFNNDPEYYMTKYKGIDSYLYFNHKDKLNVFPEGEIYSRLYGIDDKNYWDTKNEDYPEHLYYSENHNICIFNGWRRRHFMDLNSEPYLLDNDGYDGFEIYWD